MTDELKKLESAAKLAALPPTIKYVCLCAGSIVLRNKELELPSFMQSKKMKVVNVYLMPELAAGFSHREALNKSCEVMNEELGDQYNVMVCPTKNDMLMKEGFYITIN
jgi:hypothetical protein